MKTLLLFILVLTSAHAAEFAYIISDQSYGNGYAQKNLEALNKAGYQTEFSEAPTLALVAEKLKHFEATLKSGDKFILSLNCHGRVSNNTQPEELQQHHCCLNPHCSEKFHPTQLESFLKNTKAKVAIIEDACGSGSSVMALAEKSPTTCVIASTGATSLAFYGTSHLYRYFEKSQDLTSIIFEGQTDRMSQAQNEIARTSSRFNYTGCLDQNIMTFRQNYLDFSENLGDWELHQAIIFKEIYPSSNYPEETSLENLFKVSSERTALVDQSFSKIIALIKEEINKESFKRGFNNNFPRLTNAYKQKNVQFPFEQISSPVHLQDSLNKTFSEGRKLHQTLEEDIKKMNDLIKDRSPRTELQIEPLRNKIQQLHKDVRKNQIQMSILLNVYEEIKCKMNTSPCSDFKL